jgi:Probable cobalt transporter subunit (CbtA)
MGAWASGSAARSGGQAPIDFIKADTVPETPARELSWKYPANPPSVGQPDTIDQRTAVYFTMLAFSLPGLRLPLRSKRPATITPKRLLSRLRVVRDRNDHRDSGAARRQTGAPRGERACPA